MLEFTDFVVSASFWAQEHYEILGQRLNRTDAARVFIGAWLAFWAFVFLIVMIVGDAYHTIRERFRERHRRQYKIWHPGDPD